MVAGADVALAGGGAYINQGDSQRRPLSGVMGEVPPNLRRDARRFWHPNESKSKMSAVAADQVQNGAVWTIECNEQPPWPCLLKKTEIHGTRARSLSNKTMSCLWQF